MSFSSPATFVSGGTTVARAFVTSPTPFLPQPAPFAGRVSAVLNPHSLDRVSAARAAHSAVAVHVQSAGSVKKLPVPYSAGAPRNRVRNERRAPAAPFASTLTLGAGLRTTQYPWREARAQRARARA